MTRPLNAIEVALSVHEHARPAMVSESWCVNAAALVRDVMREIGIPSYAKCCDVSHMNAAYVALGHEHEPDLFPDCPFPAEGDGSQPFIMTARAHGQPEREYDIAPKDHPGGNLDGHVLTYVPDWSAWIDPSAPQFDRPQHRVLFPAPVAWLDSPPEGRCYARDDGGMTAILPTESRRFHNSSAWRTRNDRWQQGVVERICRDLAQ